MRELSNTSLTVVIIPLFVFLFVWYESLSLDISKSGLEVLGIEQQTFSEIGLVELIHPPSLSSVIFDLRSRFLRIEKSIPGNPINWDHSSSISSNLD
jgi:hypothetical protein